MRTRTDNSFMSGIGIAQIAIESKTCPSDLKVPLPFVRPIPVIPPPLLRLKWVVWSEQRSGLPGLNFPAYPKVSYTDIG